MARPKDRARLSNYAAEIHEVHLQCNFYLDHPDYGPPSDLMDYLRLRTDLPADGTPAALLEAGLLLTEAKPTGKQLARQVDDLLSVYRGLPEGDSAKDFTIADAARQVAMRWQVAAMRYSWDLSAEAIEHAHKRYGKKELKTPATKAKRRQRDLLLKDLVIEDDSVPTVVLPRRRVIRGRQGKRQTTSKLKWRPKLP